MPGNTTPAAACAGADGNATAKIGAAAAASMRNHRRRTIASDLHVSRLSSVPLSCGLLYPNNFRNGTRNCSSAEKAAALHTRPLAEAQAAKPAAAGCPKTVVGLLIS